MISVRPFTLFLISALFPLSVAAQSIDGLQVDEDGDVGIGTTSPDYRLDVSNGDARAHAFKPDNGVYFPNRERRHYKDSYKSHGYTYLMWDRNNGSGPFRNWDRPHFFYWDNDSNTLRYLIDSGNMKNLEAKFASLNVEDDAIADGLTFRNRETEGYKETYKSDHHTHLMWDRNNGGGPFSGGGCPQFAYWDNDAGTLRYLVDSCNMRYLDARFSSADVDGTLTAKTVKETSARRFKTDIEPIENATALVNELQGVRYRWKENGKPDLGFVAEEVKEVLPSLVSHAEDGRVKGLSYSHLTAVLTEALKEQTARTEDQQKQIDRLTETNEALRKKTKTQQEQIDALRRQLRQFRTRVNDQQEQQ